jgi:hypothetical protein
MKIKREWSGFVWSVLGIGVVCAGGASFVHAVQAPASAQAPNSAARFVRVKDGGAKLFNLADKSAEVVLKASAGTLLQVHGERAGYLDVSAPGGVEVWVFGEYAKAADAPGMIEITGNGVSMRPLPMSNEKSFPLAQRLMKGDRVRFLGRNDPSQPFEEDWIKVVSPVSAHAWAIAAETMPLAAGEDGSALWMAAEKSALASAALVEVPRAAAKNGANGAAASGAAAASAAKASTDAAAKAEKPKGAPVAAASQGSSSPADALANAEKLMETARKAEKPDFAPAKLAYKKIIDTTPSGAAADTARVRLQEIDAREELAALHVAAQQSEVMREEEIAKKNAELREASLYQDPLWGRFQARGWLEKDGERFVIRWANKRTAEVVCSQKRYDLNEYVGFEVGVSGAQSRAGGVEKPAIVDAARIEVLSGAGSVR